MNGIGFKVGDLVVYKGFLDGKYAKGIVKEIPSEKFFKMEIIHTNINYLNENVLLPIKSAGLFIPKRPEYFSH